MTLLHEGNPAPDFCLSDAKGKTWRLSDFQGNPLVLYFYPKDDTPGCTREACAFNDALQSLEKSGVRVVGVSRDTPESHEKFTHKFGLAFPLLSDEAGTVCEAYGVWGEKTLYGKKVLGILRTTFLIGKNGNILKIWPQVKVEGHAEEVLDAIRLLA